MKIGEYTFKRKYTLAQIIIDIVSVVVLTGFALIISAHIEWAQWFDRNNRTDYVLHKEWYPLLIWVGTAVIISGISVFLMLKSKKLPKKIRITKNNVVKYCSALDAGISCVRLMLLIIMWNLCATHSDFILWGKSEINYFMFVVGVLIIAGIVVLTWLRVSALGETEEAAERENNKKYIVED